jgi:hypothetical protein
MITVKELIIEKITGSTEDGSRPFELMLRVIRLYDEAAGKVN